MSYAQSLAAVPGWAWGLFSFLFGGCIASFLGVVGERVPRGETLGGRSHCVCGSPLPGWANVPIVGWLVSGGVAKCCGAKIPPRYVIGEVGLALAWAAIGMLSPSYWLAGVGFVLSAAVLLLLSWRRPADLA